MSNYLNFLEANILYAILALSWLLFLWEFYLNFRQKALMMRIVELPNVLEGIMTKEVYSKARSYDLDILNFSSFRNALLEIYTTIFLLCLGYHHLWLWSIDIVKYFGFSDKHEILISAVCMFILNIIYDLISLPLKVYSTFVLEQKYGFNRQTPLFFAKDQLLKFIVNQILTIPLLSASIWIVKNKGDYFFLYLWILLIAATIFMLIIYPEVIAPLFDKYTPLPEGNLKTKIEALAASVNFPLYKIYIVENSNRSVHSNAYFYGFYKYKRIVLFETLIKEYYKLAEGETEKKGCETDEVLAVLAHELGHWKYGHTLQLFVFVQLFWMINVYLYAMLADYKPMFHAFGFVDTQPTFIGFNIVTMYILMPLNVLLKFILILLGRKFEFEADRFAKILGHGQALKNSLRKMQTDNLGYPLYDKLYSGWHHNHPPILERFDAVNKED